MDIQELDDKCHKKLEILGLKGKKIKGRYDANSWHIGNRRVVVTRRKEKGNFITVQVEGRWRIRNEAEFDRLCDTCVKPMIAEIKSQ